MNKELLKGIVKVSAVLAGTTAVAGISAYGITKESVAIVNEVEKSIKKVTNEIKVNKIKKDINTEVYKTYLEVLDDVQYQLDENQEEYLSTTIFEKAIFLVNRVVE